MTKSCALPRPRGGHRRAAVLGFAASLGVVLASPIPTRAEPVDQGPEFELVKGAQGLVILEDKDLAEIRGGYLSADANASSSARRRVILWDEARTIPAPLMRPDGRNGLDFQQGPDARSFVVLSR